MGHPKSLLLSGLCCDKALSLNLCGPLQRHKACSSLRSGKKNSCYNHMAGRCMQAWLCTCTCRLNLYTSRRLPLESCTASRDRIIPEGDYCGDQGGEKRAAESLPEWQTQG